MKDMPKSGKRETAVVMLIFSGVLTVLLFGGALLGMVDATVVKALEGPFYAVVWASAGFAASAFGLHSIATQWASK